MIDVRPHPYGDKPRVKVGPGGVGERFFAFVTPTVRSRHHRQHHPCFHPVCFDIWSSSTLARSSRDRMTRIGGRGGRDKKEEGR